MTMRHDVPPRGKGCIPYILLILAMGVLVYLVISSDTSSSGAFPTPRSNANVIANDSSASLGDAAYLATLRSAYPDWAGNTDMDLVQAGHGACSALTDGNSALSVDRVLTAVYGIPSDFAAYLTGTAIGSYCPDQAGALA